MVISALDRHVHDTPKNAKALGKFGMKLKPPSTYDGDGPAQDWFLHEVEHSDIDPEGWTTLEVIQGLQQRFITPKSAAEAAQEFRILSQGTKDVRELYQALKALSLQLPSPPDAYTFRRRYMEAMHSRISQRVMGLGFSAEVTPIEMLVTLAADQESAITAQRHFDEVRPAASSSRRKDTHRSTPAAAVSPITKTGDKRAEPAECRHGPTRRPPLLQLRFEWPHGVGMLKTPSDSGGKVAELVDTCSSDVDDDDYAVPAPQMDSESESDPNSDLGGDKSDNKTDSIYGRFDNEYNLSAKSCTIVPLEDEVPACAGSPLKVNAGDDSEPVHNPAARR
ncbi:hypothetical protein BDV93DRAFT_516533 [Ceratobasidium sp. AG-I]|nr:hypothetical protein BDV93DRAFT_516746 [Ceratobasidium sp. AG-I]KAF8593470.1 hypothetical protein BDV93DRAFT_516533 [Ceratobasidium sp. AG-I]